MDGFLEYWPIFIWVVITAFYMGIVWWKVESSRRAVNILFGNVKELTKDTARQGGELDSIKEDVKRMDRNIGAMVIRFDMLYDKLMNGKG